MHTAFNPMGVGDMAKDYIIDYGESSDKTQWYRLWKSGWIEQGGIVANLSSTNQHLNNITNFIIAFTSTNYFINICGTNSSNSYSTSCGILSRELTNFKWSNSYWWSRDANVTNFCYYACGY